MIDYFHLTAPCGLDCFNCDFFKGNISAETIEKISQLRRMKKKDVPCSGCRDEMGCKYQGGTCETLTCVMTRKLSFCFECKDFPCMKLMPAADGANKFPHNFKLFNLSRMKRIGLKRWAVEESKEIRERYFEGEFVVGQGPVIPEDIQE